MKRGLLVQRLELPDAGLYTCTGHDRSYSRVLARYRLHVIPNRGLHPPHGPNHAGPPSQPGASGFLSQPGASGFLSQPVPGQRSPWPPQHPQQLPLRSYKDLHLVGGGNGLSVDEYCEQLWYREKRRQQKLRTLKLKQESRKARVRRNNPPETPRRLPDDPETL